MPDEPVESPQESVVPENSEQTAAYTEQPSSAPETSYAPQPAIVNAQPTLSAQPITDTALNVIAVKKPKKTIFIAIFAAVLLIGGGGAYGYFGVYTQLPENIWKQALSNTGEGLKKFVNQPLPSQKGGKIDGSFKLTTPTTADGTMTGSYDEKNTKLTATAGIAGVRANFELRGITPNNATSPDLYFKVDGLKSFGGLVGGDASSIGSIFKEVDNKWLFVDHTLLDQATANAASAGAKTPTSAEITKDAQELSKKVSVVLNERLFTTDDSKAVLGVKEKLAKEDFKGRRSQHLKVQVRKQQLRDMVVALKDTVKDSKVKDLLMTGQTGKTFEESINFDSTLKDIDKANYDNAVADVWVDMGLKYIRNVRISDNTDKSSPATIDFMLDYKGGDELPLSVILTTKGANGDATVNLGLNINQKSYVLKLTAGVDGIFSGQKIQGTGELTLTPSDEKISVDKPTGATNIMELIGTITGEVQSLQTQLGGQAGTNGGIQLKSLIDDFQAQ